MPRCASTSRRKLSSSFVTRKPRGSAFFTGGRTAISASLSPTEIAPIRGAIEAMSESTQPASVTVATLLKDVQSTPEGAFDLELLAGSAGLERRISNSHPQKTGLALAGFDGYLC